MGRTATAEAVKDENELLDEALAPSTVAPDDGEVWRPTVVLGLPVVAVALTHEGRWQQAGEHAAVVTAVRDDGTVNLWIVPAWRDPLRAQLVRHISETQPFERWAWRHVHEEIPTEPVVRSSRADDPALTGMPEAEQP